MTDGPFKNLPLSSSLKRFAEAVQNESVDDATRCALASDALLRGIFNECHALLQKLQNYGQDRQLDLDPCASIQCIFDSHPKSEFSDHLEREVGMRLHQGGEPKAAILNGLEAALEISIGKLRSRIQEAGLESHRKGMMYRDEFDRLIKGCDRTLENIDRPRTLAALIGGIKSAFKQETQKRKGLNDGPKL